MREIFKCKPFTGPGNTPRNFSEARDRIVYTALNYRWLHYLNDSGTILNSCLTRIIHSKRHSPIGNTVQFGTLVAIMRPSYVRNMMLITPEEF